MTERNDIEDLFSSVFEGAEMTPPDIVKSAIDAALFGAPADTKKRTVWWIWPLAILLLLGGGSSLYLSTTGQTTEVNQTVDQGETSADGVQEMDQSIAHSSLSASPGENEVPQENTDPAFDRTVGISPTAYIDPASGNPNYLAVKHGQGADAQISDGKIPEDGLQEVNADSQSTTDASGSRGSSAKPFLLDGSITQQRKVLEKVDVLSMHAPKLFSGPSAGELLALAPDARIEQAPKQNPWSIAAYAGTSFGMNTLRGMTGLTLEEQAGVYASAELIYPLSRHFLLSGGIDFTQRVDRLVQHSTFTDSLFVGNQYVYIYDSAQLVVDTAITPQYQTTTVEQIAAGRIRFYSIGIPIYLHYQLGLGEKVLLDLSAGVRCAYMKYTPEDIVPNVTYPESFSQFGLNVSLRPELLVPINRFQIGFYGRVEYDALHGMQWNAVTRTRWSAGFGLSLRFKL